MELQVAASDRLRVEGVADVEEHRAGQASGRHIAHHLHLAGEVGPFEGPGREQLGVQRVAHVDDVHPHEGAAT